MVINILIGAAIALLPLFLKINGVFDTNRASKDFLFMYVALGLSVFMTKKKRELPPDVLLAAGFIAVMTVLGQTEFFSSNVLSHSLNIFIGLTLFVHYYTSADHDSIQYIFDGMVVGSLIQAVFTLCGHVGIELYYTLFNKYYMAYEWVEGMPLLTATTQGRGWLNSVGSLDNPNLVAAYLCLTIPAFFTRRWYKYLVWISVFALLATNSLISIGSLIVGWLYWFNSQKGYVSKGGIYLLAILSMLLLPVVTWGVDSGRFSMWKHVLLSASWKHWLIGMGPGWFANQQMDMGAIGGGGRMLLIQEHNAFLTFFNIYGLLGFLAIAPMFRRWCRNPDDNPVLSTILFIAFCNSYGHFLTHQSTALIIVIPVLALCLGRSKIS